MTRWLFAFVHLLALGIGLGAVWVRGRALRGTLDRDGLRRVFLADSWWAGAAFLWISTGLVRLFAGLEKDLDYYLLNHLFWAKMALLILILVLEVAPMIGLIRWRKVSRTGGAVDTSAAGRYARVSTVQAVLVVLMVLLATGMARGSGAR